MLMRNLLIQDEEWLKTVVHLGNIWIHVKIHIEEIEVMLDF